MQLQYALTATPTPLSAYERRQLSWGGATERFLDAVTDSATGNTLPSLADHSARWVHQAMQQGGQISDVLRKMTGAGPASRQAWMLHPRYRHAEVTEIVEQSVRHSPPVA